MLNFTVIKALQASSFTGHLCTPMAITMVQKVEIQKKIRALLWSKSHIMALNHSVNGIVRYLQGKHFASDLCKFPV